MQIIIVGIFIIAALVAGFLVRNPDYTPPSADDVKQEVINKGEEVIKEKVKEAITETVDEYLPDLPSSPVFPETPDAVKEIIEKVKDAELPDLEILSYESPHGFSFKYNPLYSIENTRVVLPGGKVVQAVAVVRYVKEQWCSQSGLPEHCRPFLENPAVAFGVIGNSPADVVANYLSDIVDSMETVEVAGITAAQFYAGVEGEGVITILIPLSNENKTLIVQYTYDEIFNSGSHSREILDSEGQKEVVDRILGTLELE